MATAIAPITSICADPVMIQEDSTQTIPATTPNRSRALACLDWPIALTALFIPLVLPALRQLQSDHIVTPPAARWTKIAGFPSVRIDGRENPIELSFPACSPSEGGPDALVD